MINIPRFPSIGSVGIESALVPHLVGIPCVPNAEVMVVAVLTKRKTVGFGVHLSRVRNSTRSQDVLPPIAGGSRTSIGIKKYDFGVHLVGCRWGIREEIVEVIPICIGSICRRGMCHYDGEVTLMAAEFYDQQSGSQQSQ